MANADCRTSKRQRTPALAGSDGTARHPALSWTAAAYVSHVADNLRIYAERLAGAALGAAGPITEYDQDALADARNYNLISVESALWSIEHGVADMLAALALCGPATTLTFVDGATASVHDVLLRTTHDAVHHVWDVGRR